MRACQDGFQETAASEHGSLSNYSDEELRLARSFLRSNVSREHCLQQSFVIQTSVLDALFHRLQDLHRAYVMGKV